MLSSVGPGRSPREAVEIRENGELLANWNRLQFLWLVDGLSQRILAPNPRRSTTSVVITVTHDSFSARAAWACFGFRYDGHRRLGVVRER